MAQKQSTTKNKNKKKAELNHKAPANKREWNGVNEWAAIVRLEMNECRSWMAGTEAGKDMPWGVKKKKGRRKEEERRRKKRKRGCVPSFFLCVCVLLFVCLSVCLLLVCCRGPCPPWACLSPLSFLSAWRWVIPHAHCRHSWRLRHH